MSRIFILIIRAYQLLISPVLGANCRFTPSCSEYAIQAFQKYGAWRGAWRALKRLGCCHPGHPGGYDPLT